MENSVQSLYLHHHSVKTVRVDNAQDTHGGLQNLKHYVNLCFVADAPAMNGSIDGEM